MTIQALLNLDLTNQENVKKCLEALRTRQVSTFERGNNGVTLLHAAASAGCKELINDILFYAPSLLLAVDRDGKTAAQYALEGGHRLIGTALLSAEKYLEDKQASERAAQEAIIAELVQGKIHIPANAGETKRQRESATLTAVLIEDHIKKPEEVLRNSLVKVQLLLLLMII
jgi:ankyrin repeat protein